MPNPKVIAGVFATSGLLAGGTMAYQPNRNRKLSLQPDHYLDLYRLPQQHCTSFNYLDE